MKPDLEPALPEVPYRETPTTAFRAYAPEPRPEMKTLEMPEGWSEEFWATHQEAKS